MFSLFYILVVYFLHHDLCLHYNEQMNKAWLGFEAEDFTIITQSEHHTQLKGIPVALQWFIC